MTPNTPDLPDSSANDFSSFAHRARRSLIPTAIIAAVLTAEHQRGFSYTVGAVTAWLLFACSAAAEAGHFWLVCSHCEGPPSHFATPEARARVMRRAHSRKSKLLNRLLFVSVLLATLGPKPYLHYWWGQAGTAIFYAGFILLFAHRVCRSIQHEEFYREECQNAQCRSGMKPLSLRGAAIGHYGPWILAGLVPVMCTVGLLTLHRSFTYRLVYDNLLVLTTIVIGCMVFDHVDTPCVRCARIPVNGGEAAEEQMPWLHWYHYVGTYLISAAAFLWGVSWMLPNTAPGRILTAAGAFLLLPWGVLHRVHGRLKPWCPWCRDDGGHEDRESDPDPSRNKPAPV